jgi:hypothetical protein
MRTRRALLQDAYRIHRLVDDFSDDRTLLHRAYAERPMDSGTAFRPGTILGASSLDGLGRIWNVLVRAKFVLRQWTNADSRFWERRRLLSNATAGDPPRIRSSIDQAPRKR